VQPLLRSLCAGVFDTDLPAATAGLLAAAPHVRAAALLALPSVPSLGEGVPPEGEPLADLHTAKFDPSEANAEAATSLWEDVGCELPSGEAEWFVAALVAHLASVHPDVRNAAAAALAAAVDAEPVRVAAAMRAVVGLYDSGEDENLKQKARRAAAATAAPVAAQKKSGKGFVLEEEDRKLQVCGWVWMWMCGCFVAGRDSVCAVGVCGTESLSSSHPPTHTHTSQPTTQMHPQCRSSPSTLTTRTMQPAAAVSQRGEQPPGWARQ